VADAIDAAGLGCVNADVLILAGALLEQAAAMSRVAREVGRLREVIEDAERAKALGVDDA